MAFRDTDDLQRDRRRLKELLARIDAAFEILEAINRTSTTRGSYVVAEQVASMSNAAWRDLFSTCEELTRRYHAGEREPPL